MDKTRFEKEAYERTALLITTFGQQDVITTSDPDFDDETGILRRVFQTH